MTTMLATLPTGELRTFCRLHDIVSLKLFGSAIRDDFTEGGDSDLLVEFAPKKRIGFFGLSEIESELSELLGRKVDLNTTASLSPHFREQVLADAVTIFSEDIGCPAESNYNHCTP